MSGKTVYFLGAGATKDVCEGAPLNRDLVKKALDRFSEEEETKHLKHFINQLFKERTDPTIDNQVWNLLDYIIEQGKVGSSRYNLEEISELRENLLSLIIREIKEALEDAETETYAKFLEAIKESEPSVISTNYDILIDSALYKIDCYNYVSKIRNSLISQGSSLKGLNKAQWRGEDNMNTGQIKLLKIHGSLNWLYCSKCDEVDLIMTEEGTISVLTGLYCYNEYCTNRYESLLITPTMYKSYENRFIKEIWGSAEKELTEADNLVFIGYALKDEDYHIRCLLMKALLNKSDPYKEIIVIEKGPSKNSEKEAKDKRTLEDLKNKYRDLYGEVDFRPVGFTRYVDSLQPQSMEKERR